MVRPNLDPKWEPALAPYRAPLVKMKVKCKCGNTLGMAYPVPGLPMVDFQRFTKPARANVATRPWASAKPMDERHFLEGGTLQIVCSKNCSRSNHYKWALTVDRLTASFVRAGWAGCMELVFGDNL